MSSRLLSDESNAIALPPSERVSRAAGLRAWQKLCGAGELGALRAFEDNEVLFEREDPVSATYFLTAGAVEIVHRNDAGVGVVVKILVGPSLFGAIEPLAGEPRYLEGVRVLGRASVAVMLPDRFIELCSTQVRAGFEALVETSRAFCVAARFEPSRLADTEALLANLLCAYATVCGSADPQGIHLDLRRTQADFANAIGANERSVNRVLTAWKEQDLVDKNAGHYVLRNVDALRERARGLDGSLVHSALPCV